MNEAYNKLCVDGALKQKYQHLETKGLTHFSHMPRKFQVKWIRFIIIYVHNGKLWLDHPIKILKKMIHKITTLPMLNKAKTTKILGWVELAKKTLAKWDIRGMNLSRLIDMDLKLGIHVIVHNI